METSYGIVKGLFELDYVQEELEIVQLKLDEIARLQSIGYGRSQTAIDIALDVVCRLAKVKTILEVSGIPNTESQIQKLSLEIEKMTNVIREMKRPLD